MSFMKLAKTLRRFGRLPGASKAKEHDDRCGLPDRDPGAEAAVDHAIRWLLRAQECSRSQDGGVAWGYTLQNGWSTSYPETTGYIIPTLIEYSSSAKNESIRENAQRMLDWLVAIQFTEGGFQGGRIDQSPKVPVSFNTGQILLGLAAGVSEFGDRYREPMRRAADWLAGTQDPDGCWRMYPSPFARAGDKSFDTHIAWGLFEADRIEPGRGYADAARANVGWALKNQKANGWFRNCCLSNPKRPLTHTLGYAWRGVIEAYAHTDDPILLEASTRTGDALLDVVDEEGRIPGRLDSNWAGVANWVCLTGSAQMACCWLRLHAFTDDSRYQRAASLVNTFLRRTLVVEGLPDMCGAVKGAFPISGGYVPYAYPNWACKFFVDSHLMEFDRQSMNKTTMLEVNHKT